MVSNIVSIDNKIIVDTDNILYRLEKSFIYGVSLEIWLGTSTEFGLVIGEEYQLYFNDKDSAFFTLTEKATETIDIQPLKIYKFVKKLNHQLKNNTLPNNASAFSVSLKEYITEKENQLKFIMFKLRCKSLCLVNDKGTLEPIQKHIMELLMTQPIEDKNNYDVKVLEGKTVRKLNYYTILEDGSYPRTKYGLGTPKYIPFASKEEIKGLDNYIMPKFELNTDMSILETGNTVIVNDTKCVVMEKEEFNYGNTFATTLICGVKSDA